MEFATLFRLTAGVILTLSFLSKAWDIGGFAATITDFQLLRGRVATRMAAIGVVSCEGITAFGLLSGWHLKPAVLGAALLLAAFSVVAAWSILRGADIDCGCLGKRIGLRMGWISVAANLALVGGLLVQLHERSMLAPLAVSHSRGPTATSIVLVLSAVLFAAVYWLIPYAQSVTELVDTALSTHSTLELKT